MREPITFSLTLRQLAPDASAADMQFPDVTLENVTPDQLRGMLTSLVAMAPAVTPPLAPEMRILSPHGRFLVQLKEGQTRFSSWSLRESGRASTPEEILAAISGVESVELESSAGGALPRLAYAMPTSRVVKIVLLVVTLIGSNALTAWMVLRPSPDLLPAHRLLHGEPAKRVMATFTGEWSTGTQDGDRAFIIDGNGAGLWMTITLDPERSQDGEKGELAETTPFTVQPAEVAGKAVLVTSMRAVIELKDEATAIFFGEAYRRKRP